MRSEPHTGRSRLFAATFAAVISIAVTACDGVSDSGRLQSDTGVPRGVFKADLESLDGLTPEQRSMVREQVRTMELVLDGQGGGVMVLAAKGQELLVRKLETIPVRGSQPDSFEARIATGERLLLSQAGARLHCSNCMDFGIPNDWNRKPIQF